MFSAQTHGYYDRAEGYGHHLAAATHRSAVGKVEDGHYFHLQLQLDAEGVVQDLAFSCPHCLPAIACGGYLYERLVGRRADQELTLEQVLGDLGGLPPQRSFYAWMAVKAVTLALA